MNRERHTILATKPLIQLTVTLPRQSTAVAPTGSPAFLFAIYVRGNTCFFKAWLRATSIVFLVAVHEDDQDCTYVSAHGWKC
jgi:hypothetical protein